MKKIFTWLLVLLLAFTMVACGGGGTGETADGDSEETAGDEVMVLRIGHAASTAAAYHLACLDFEKELEAATNGRIDVQVFPSNQLGSEKDMDEQLQLGTLEMAVSNCAPLGNFVTDIQIMDMPFLFQQGTLEQAHENLNGEFGQALMAAGEAAGIKIFGFGEIGYKNITNRNHPVKTVADIKSLKIRVQETPILIDVYKSIGADPTPVAFGEVYTAIQTGVVDGYEGSYEPYCDINLYEIAPYISEVGIGYGAAGLCASLEWYNSLDADLKAALDEAGANWVVNQRTYMGENTKKLKQKCIDEGTEIIETADIDVQSFIDASQAVWDKHPEFSDYYKLIKGNN